MATPPPPPPPLPSTRGIVSSKLPTQLPQEPPACIQNAMMKNTKKPFTYTPGGIDLSQIKSQKIARRIQRNAMSEGVSSTPQPAVTQRDNTSTNDVGRDIGAFAVGMPFQVLPNVTLNQKATPKSNKFETAPIYRPQQQQQQQQQHQSNVYEPTPNSFKEPAPNSNYRSFDRQQIFDASQSVNRQGPSYGGVYEPQQCYSNNTGNAYDAMVCNNAGIKPTFDGFSPRCCTPNNPINLPSNYGQNKPEVPRQSRFFKLLESTVGSDPVTDASQYQDAGERNHRLNQPNSGIARGNFTQGNEPSAPYEPKMYTGGNIPSRSFKLLQAMMQSDQDEEYPDFAHQLESALFSYSNLHRCSDNTSDMNDSINKDLMTFSRDKDSCQTCVKSELSEEMLSDLNHLEDNEIIELLDGTTKSILDSLRSLHFQYGLEFDETLENAEPFNILSNFQELTKTRQTDENKFLRYVQGLLKAEKTIRSRLSSLSETRSRASFSSDKSLHDNDEEPEKSESDEINFWEILNKDSEDDVLPPTWKSRQNLHTNETYEEIKESHEDENNTSEHECTPKPIEENESDVEKEGLVKYLSENDYESEKNDGDADDEDEINEEITSDTYANNSNSTSSSKVNPEYVQNDLYNSVGDFSNVHCNWNPYTNENSCEYCISKEGSEYDSDTEINLECDCKEIYEKTSRACHTDDACMMENSKEPFHQQVDIGYIDIPHSHFDFDEVENRDEIISPPTIYKEGKDGTENDTSESCKSEILSELIVNDYSEAINNEIVEGKILILPSEKSINCLHEHNENISIQNNDYVLEENTNFNIENDNSNKDDCDSSNDSDESDEIEVYKHEESVDLIGSNCNYNVDNSDNNNTNNDDDNNSNNRNKDNIIHFIPHQLSIIMELSCSGETSSRSSTPDSVKSRETSESLHNNDDSSYNYSDEENVSEEIIDKTLNNNELIDSLDIAHPKLYLNKSPSIKRYSNNDYINTCDQEEYHDNISYQSDQEEYKKNSLCYQSDSNFSNNNNFNHNKNYPKRAASVPPKIVEDGRQIEERLKNLREQWSQIAKEVNAENDSKNYNNKWKIAFYDVNSTQDIVLPIKRKMVSKLPLIITTCTPNLPKTLQFSYGPKSQKGKLIENKIVQSSLNESNTKQKSEYLIAFEKMETKLRNKDKISSSERAASCISPTIQLPIQPSVQCDANFSSPNKYNDYENFTTMVQHSNSYELLFKKFQSLNCENKQKGLKDETTPSLVSFLQDQKDNKNQLTLPSDKLEVSSTSKRTTRRNFNRPKSMIEHTFMTEDVQKGIENAESVVEINHGHYRPTSCTKEIETYWAGKSNKNKDISRRARAHSVTREIVLCNSRSFETKEPNLCNKEEKRINYFQSSIEDDDSGVQSSKCESEFGTDTEGFHESKNLYADHDNKSKQNLVQCLQDYVNKKLENVSYTPQNREFLNNLSGTSSKSSIYPSDSENLEKRKNKLTLPLENQYSTNLKQKGLLCSTQEKVANELVQSLLEKENNEVFRNISMQKLQAAAIKILQEENALRRGSSGSTLNSTPALTPSEFQSESPSYDSYHASFGGSDDADYCYNLFPSKAFKKVHDQVYNSRRYE